MNEKSGWKGLKKAATAMVAEVESGDSEKIQEAVARLKSMLSRTVGRPARFSDNEFAALNHMTTKDAAKKLGVKMWVVYRWRKLKGKS